MKIQDIIRQAEGRISFNIDINRAKAYTNDAIVDLASRFETATVLGHSIAIIKENQPLVNPSGDRVCLFGPPERLIRLSPKTMRVKTILKELDSEYTLNSNYTQVEAEQQGLFKGPGLNYLDHTKIGENIDFLKYQIESGYIEFSEEGNYHIYYYKIPENVVNTSDEPETHEAYHNAIVYYVAAQEMHRLFGEENSDVMFLFAKYEKMAADTHMSLSAGNKKRRRYIPAMRW